MNGLQNLGYAINAEKISLYQIENSVLTVLIKSMKKIQSDMTVNGQKNTSQGAGKYIGRKKRMEYASGAIKKQHRVCIALNVL